MCIIHVLLKLLSRVVSLNTQGQGHAVHVLPPLCVARVFGECCKFPQWLHAQPGHQLGFSAFRAKKRLILCQQVWRVFYETNDYFVTVLTNCLTLVSNFVIFFCSEVLTIDLGVTLVSSSDPTRPQNDLKSTAWNQNDLGRLCNKTTHF